MVSLPKVSIIIPFYNRIAMLHNTLRSISEQKYTDYEVILVDDFSEEKINLARIEEYFVRDRFNYLRLKENSGPGVARQQGVRHAQGNYILYLDSDDLIKPEFLSSTVPILEKYPNISMVFSNVLIKRKDRQNIRHHLDEGAYDFFELIFDKKIYWATGSALWRNSITHSDNWKDLRDHEDFVHDILSLIDQPEIYSIAEALCVVNKDSESGIERTNNEMMRSLILLLSDKGLKSKFNQRELALKFLDFIYFRLSKRKYELKDIPLYFKLVHKATHWSQRPLTLLKKFGTLLIKKINISSNKNQY